MATPALDRRQRRRQETIEEVLDLAVELMTEHGVVGLSVGEIARRMGIQPPSLYVYFPSKNALYDAVFARGAQSVLDSMQGAWDSLTADDKPLEQLLLESGRLFVGWSLDNPAYSQLLFWRPVPHFTPSPEAFAPAVRLTELAVGWMRHLQERGLLRDDVPAEDLYRDWTVVTAGVVSQQLSNAPQDGLDDGRFTAALPALVAMFARHHGTPPPARSMQPPPARPLRRRARHADRG